MVRCSLFFFDPFLALIFVEFIFLLDLAHPVVESIFQVQLTELLFLFCFIENNAESIFLEVVVTELHFLLVGPFEWRREQRIDADST